MQSLWMIVASLSFACMGVCVKFAAQEGFSAAEIVFYRCAIALVLMTLMVRLRGVSLRTPHWGFQLKRGISGFLALTLYFWAITLLPLGTAVTLNYTAPIFLAVLLMVLAGVRLTSGMVLALLTGLVGVALLLVIYLYIISRCLFISMQAQNSFERLLGGALTLTFFVYVFVNMGMVSGILPVVGVPLPLVSYGGTSMVTLMAGFGVLMSIQTHRRLLA